MGVSDHKQKLLQKIKRKVFTKYEDQNQERACI